MRKSDERILTTHVGSLPRPPALRDLLVQQDRGEAVDAAERYVMALAREMRKEYELIHGCGLVLQLDCPDLAMERTRFFQDEPLERFLQAVELHIEAINRAIANIPPERVRLHVCWGNYDGPHVHDVPPEAILPLLYRARVGALSLIRLANEEIGNEPTP